MVHDAQERRRRARHRRRREKEEHVDDARRVDGESLAADREGEKLERTGGQRGRLSRPREGSGPLLEDPCDLLGRALPAGLEGLLEL